MLMIDMQKIYIKNLIMKIQVIIMICMFKLIYYYFAGVFKNFRNKCIEVYELDPAYFLSAPG